jgi:hypothetical protein
MRPRARAGERALADHIAPVRGQCCRNVEQEAPVRGRRVDREGAVNDAEVAAALAQFLDKAEE